MEKAIKEAKALIDNYYKNNGRYYGFSEYTHFYLGTNEKINEYLKKDKFKPHERALSVLASGDQAFNLIANGLTEIDTFDINRLTEYYALGFKKALITKSSYEDFLKVIKKLSGHYTSSEEIFSIVSDTIPFIDKDYRRFWQEILDYYFKIEKEHSLDSNILHAIGIPIYDLAPNEKYSEFNSYTINEEIFNTFKSRLMKSNISFKHANAANLWDSFPKKSYNYVLLSNILTYLATKNKILTTQSGLKSYINSLAELIDNEGIIYLYYAFWYNENELDCTLREIVNENEIYDCNDACMYLKRIKNGEIIWKKQ